MAIKDGRPSILFGLPTGLGHCSPDVAMWLMNMGFECGQRGLVSKYGAFNLRSSRILANRNMFAEEAIRDGFDYLLMVDPDMRPDLYARPDFGGTSRDTLPTARPFLSVALEFLAANPFAVIGAPACCDPPTRYVNVYRFREDGAASRVTHEEAYKEVTAAEPAVEQVAAIGTGLVMIPTKIFLALKRPFFDDEYKGPAKTDVERTQDIYFTENCSKSGIGVYAAWMCWAGHHKDVVLGCPGLDEQWAPTIAKQPASKSLEEACAYIDRKLGIGPSSLWGEKVTNSDTFGIEINPNPPPFRPEWPTSSADGRAKSWVDIGPDASWRPPVTLARAGG